MPVPEQSCYLGPDNFWAAQITSSPCAQMCDREVHVNGNPQQQQQQQQHKKWKKLAENAVLDKMLTEQERVTDATLVRDTAL